MVAPQGKWKLEQFLAVLMDERGGAGFIHAWSCSSRTPARNGRNSIDRSQPSMLNSSRWVKKNEEARRLTADAPGSARSSPPPLSPPLVERKTSDHGRDLAAWLGLVPRQFTTGGKHRKLLEISKRGNKYLRK